VRPLRPVRVLQGQKWLDSFKTLLFHLKNDFLGVKRVGRGPKFFLDQCALFWTKKGHFKPKETLRSNKVMVSAL